MKKKLIQLLQDASIEDPAGNSYEQRVIADNDFDDLADGILRLFNEGNTRDVNVQKQSLCFPELIRQRNKMLEVLEKVVRTAPIGLGGWDALLEAKYLRADVRKALFL